MSEQKPEQQDLPAVTTPATPAQASAAQLKARFASAIEQMQERLGEITLYVKREQLVEICEFLRRDPKLQFNLLSDLTGLDLGLEADPRFEVIYHLTSLPNRARLRLKVRVSEDDCHVPTVCHIWKTAGWHEREVFDLFGVQFTGHPDMRKILTPDDLEGHPLRKDFPLRGY